MSDELKDNENTRPYKATSNLNTVIGNPNIQVDDPMNINIQNMVTDNKKAVTSNDQSETNESSDDQKKLDNTVSDKKDKSNIKEKSNKDNKKNITKENKSDDKEKKANFSLISKIKIFLLVFVAILIVVLMILAIL